MKCSTAYFQSPLGWIRVASGLRGIASLGFEKSGHGHTGKLSGCSWDLRLCLSQLKEYFKGSRKRFSVRLNPQGTLFQKKVWAQIRRIGYGRTVSYQQIASRIGQSKATRAVGQAAGRNPVCILVPCHRVLASRGLGGYSAGTQKKKWLLGHESLLKRARV